MSTAAFLIVDEQLQVCLLCLELSNLLENGLDIIAEAVGVLFNFISHFAFLLLHAGILRLKECDLIFMLFNTFVDINLLVHTLQPSFGSVGLWNGFVSMYVCVFFYIYCLWLMADMGGHRRDGDGR